MAEMANSNDGEYTGISADGFIRYQQFVEGCSALVDRCHRKCPAGGLAFDLLGTVCGSKDRTRPASTYTL